MAVHAHLLAIYVLLTTILGFIILSISFVIRTWQGKPISQIAVIGVLSLAYIFGFLSFFYLYDSLRLQEELREAQSTKANDTEPSQP
jgi:hypothetical protein